MEQIFYSEDRDLCTFPKGCRFESVRILKERDDLWIHGMGYLGCHTWLKLTPTQQKYVEKHMEVKNDSTET